MKDYNDLFHDKCKSDSKFLSKIGWRYVNPDTQENMVELHVDVFHSLLTDVKKKMDDGWADRKMNEYIHTRYGGNKSERLPPNTKMLFFFRS